MNITKTTKTLAALAAGFALTSAASDQGLVAHFTFDDAAHFGFDSVQQAEIGTIVNMNAWPDSASDVVAPTSCEAPIVRGLQTATGWWQGNYMQVSGSSFGSAHGIPYGNQPVTYSLWIKPYNAAWQNNSSGIGMGAECRLLHHGGNSCDWDGDYDHETIYIAKNSSTGYPKIVFGVGNRTSSSSSAIYDIGAPFDGNWHFIVATYSNRMLTLYYDGQKVAEKELSGNVTRGDNAPLRFSDTTDNYNNWQRDRYLGSADDIKVYNRALDASEILAAYNAGAVAHDSDVLAWIGPAAGGAVENLGNWVADSNRRTSADVYAAGAVLDVTDVNDGATVAHNASATLALKGAICTNGQDEVTLRMQSGTLAMKRPSTQRGLVAHFSFDDPDELTFDSGTAGLTATTNVLIYGSTTAATPIRSIDGVGGKAMYFPESGSWSYYASPYMKTDSATTKKANGIPCGGEAVSYSFWIKPVVGGLWDNGMYGLADNVVWLFRRGSWGNGNATYLWLSKGSGHGKLWWSIADYIGSDGTCSYEPSDLFDGNWHHVVCTYENKTLNLYYDGAKVVSTTASYALNISDGAAISLGCSVSEGNSNDWYRRYLGGFDEFKIFNVALTDAEVATEYAQRSRTLDTASPGTVPSPVTIQLDAGTTATVHGLGNEYGTLAGAGSVAVKPGSELALDGTFALTGELTGGGAISTSGLTAGCDTDAFTGDFTIAENARVEAFANGVMLNAAFGGRVVLPANAVVVWGGGSQSGVATITAASFELPDNFSGWKDENGHDLSCRVANGILYIRKKTGTILTIQ